MNHLLQAQRLLAWGWKCQFTGENSHHSDFSGHGIWFRQMLTTPAFMLCSVIWRTTASQYSHIFFLIGTQCSPRFTKQNGHEVQLNGWRHGAKRRRCEKECGGMEIMTKCIGWKDGGSGIRDEGRIVRTGNIYAWMWTHAFLHRFSPCHHLLAMMADFPPSTLVSG